MPTLHLPHPTRATRLHLGTAFGATLLSLLAACGGGGGSSGDTASTPADPNAAAVARALSVGNASSVDLPVVMAATRAQIDTQQARYSEARRALYALDAAGQPGASSPAAIDWDPTHDSSTFELLDSGRNHVVLAGNWRYSDQTAGSGAVLGVVGHMPGSEARYAAFGGNPLGVRGNAAMDQLMKNTVAWLAPRSQAPDFRIVTAHLPGTSTYWFPHEPRVRSWFAGNYPGVTINGLPAAQATADDTCDGDKLDACLQGADLLVIGREQGPSGANSSTPDNYPATYDGTTVMRAVAAAQARGTPVLYLHHYRDANDLAGRLLASFGLASHNNYFAQEGLKAYGAANLPATPSATAATQALLQRLDAGTFSTTWSGCVNNLGRMQCERTSGFAGDAALSDEFAVPAQAIRTRLRALDASGLALFSQPGYTLEKLLVLLGDKYRESVSYPMTKEAAGPAFFRAFFSDMTAYVNRPSNAVARNLGNFSGLFAADTPTIDRTVTATAPATGRTELTTGLYVMPGRSVTLTRTDTSAATVTMGLNMLRDTTHVYDTYDRPTMLASPRVALVAGQPLTITSPTGGPLYLFIGATAGAPTVQVTVSGVITHPVLRNARDAAQVAAFRAELDSTPTNWVVFATDTLTVHSNLPNFRTTLAAHGGDLALLAERIGTYMVEDTYELAGFNSATPGALTLAPAVATFCTNAGWDCTGTQHRRDVMQHVISDNHADCGAGCSGNPYDQDWALEPLGWGETHEIGHNLQTARLNIYGGQSTEVSNNIFPSHKQMAFNRATAPASPITARSGSTKLAFDQIKASLATANPTAAMTAAIWTNTAYAADNSMRLNFYRQLVEYARTYNTGLADGWELYTLLYLLDRNVTASAATWSTAAAGLGFGTYATYPSTMNGNDFMVIATSRITGRDMRPVFDLWGVTYSAAASAQVAAYALPAAAKLLFPMSHLNQWGAGVGAPVTMTTSAVYPAGF